MTHSLPTDIPTAEEIVSSTHVLCQYTGSVRKVVRVRSYVIKLAILKDNLAREEENTRFISQQPGLNVPKVYELGSFEDSSLWPFDHHPRSRYPDAKVFYLISDFIPGDTLENRGDHLSPEQHLVVQRNLREQFNLLRSIKSPQSCFGDHASHWDDRCFFTHSIFFRAGNMPYTDNDKLMEATLRSLLGDTRRPWPLSEERRNEVERVVEVIRRESSLFQGFSPTLTHGDLHPGNIMLTIVGKKGEGVECDLDGENDIVVTVIDWEQMLWVPEWYQYCLLERQMVTRRWWNDMVEAALDPWFPQLLWWRVLSYNRR